MLPSGQKKVGPFTIIIHATTQRKKGCEKKVNKGILTVPFVADDIPPEHKFPGLGLPAPSLAAVVRDVTQRSPERNINEECFLGMQSSCT